MNSLIISASALLLKMQCVFLSGDCFILFKDAEVFCFNTLCSHEKKYFSFIASGDPLFTG